MNKSSLYSSSMLEMIDNIVEVVLNSYFYWVEDYAYKEDLMQEGYLKAYELLKTGNYDPNKSLRNYLYTGVRNAMTNLNYHNKKEKHSSYDLYNDNIAEDKYIDDYILTTNNQFTPFEIPLEDIIKSCNKFNSNYLGNILDYLYNEGLTTELSDIRVEKPNSIVYKAIIVDIMWGIREKE